MKTSRLSPRYSHQLSELRLRVARYLGDKPHMQADLLDRLTALGGDMAMGHPVLEHVEIEQAPGDLVVLDDIESLLDDTAAAGNSDRDHRRSA